MNIHDTAVRAMTLDGSFRVIAIRTTDMVRHTIARQELRGELAPLFAELLTGAVLVRQTMAPAHRVQLILKGQGSDPRQATMIADSHPEGMTRGLVQRADAPGAYHALTHQALLQVMRVLYNGELQQGFVHTPDEGGISNALTHYMLTSEQITSVIELGAVVEGGEVVSSGGFIVQLLPEARPEMIEIMLARLEERERLTYILADRGMEPTRIIAELLEGIAHTILGDEPVSSGCNCSELRIVSAMATLSEEEVRELVEEGGVLDIVCDYCRTPYSFSSERLRSLLETQ